MKLSCSLCKSCSFLVAFAMLADSIGIARPDLALRNHLWCQHLEALVLTDLGSF